MRVCQNQPEMMQINRNSLNQLKAGGFAKARKYESNHAYIGYIYGLYCI